MPFFPSVAVVQLAERFAARLGSIAEDDPAHGPLQNHNTGLADQR